MANAIDAILGALSRKEQELALQIGRGQIGADKREQKIGVVQGLAQAIAIVKETAKAVDKESREE